MGNPKQKWTAEEEEALRAGIAKHGAGKWKLIQRDPDFNHLLFSRSNIDLKDKWRNLSGYGSTSSGVQGSRDKSRTPKPKVIQDVPSILCITPDTSPVTDQYAASEDLAIVVSSKQSADPKNPTKYNSLIFEALSALKDSNGSDIGAIVNYIEQRHETPQNFRRQLGSRLRRLASQDILEKVEHRYKMKSENNAIATPSLKPKEAAAPIKPSQSSSSIETVEEAAVAAAYKIVEAENKSFVAAEAVKEADRVLRMAEEVESMWYFAKEIFDKCHDGEVVVLT